MSSKRGIIAGDVVPLPPKINSLQAIMRLRRKRECGEWYVLAFSLNRDMIRPDGTLDELHAVVFSLGNFDDENKAEEHAKSVIETTGHPGIMVARYGCPVPLTTTFDPKSIVEVHVDIKGKLMEMESAAYKREREAIEKRYKIEEDIMKESEDETDPEHIEYFKRQCYLAIKNRSSYQVHKKESEAAWDNYKKRESMVRDHFARHPEHEKQWLPYLKEKLIERGESNLYDGMERAYKELRDELLGLSEPTSTDIACECGPVCSGLNLTQTQESVTTTDHCYSDIESDECSGGVCVVKQDSDSEECSGGICVVKQDSESDECSGGVCVVKQDSDTSDDKTKEDELITEDELSELSKQVVKLSEISKQIVEETTTPSPDDDEMITQHDLTTTSKTSPTITDEPISPEKVKLTKMSKRGRKRGSKR